MKDVDAEPDQETLETEDFYMKAFNEKLGKQIGYFGTELDVTDSCMRNREAKMGNFVADLMRTEYATDFAIINSGSFRINKVIPEGPLSMLTVQSCFPFPDTVVVLKMKGYLFKEALEVAVQDWPAEDGKFPHISNVKFLFDPSKPKF